jgi:hypothetical protein
MKLRRNVLVIDKGSNGFAVRWAVVGKHGAAEYHGNFYPHNYKWARDMAEITTPSFLFHSYGFECHSRKPFDYDKEAQCSHDNCALLDGPCWHDGTSLYASEWTIQQRTLQNRWIFSQLEYLYYEWFSKEATND